MVEHLGGNMWSLEEGEFVGPDPKNGIVGPAIVRLDDQTDIGLIGVQAGETFLEVDGHSLEDFKMAVKTIPED